MLADDRVLVISRYDRWSEDLVKELRRVGYRQIDTARQPLDALPILWEGAPEILILDFKSLGAEMLDVLRLCQDNHKPIALTLALARCREGAGTREMAAEQDVLREFGIEAGLDGSASVVAVVRELERLRATRESEPENSQQFSLILFLNDRHRVEELRQALDVAHFQIRVVNDFNALSGEFMSDPPDMVLIDPRGVTRALAPLANLSRLFPNCGINFIVPIDLQDTWRRKQPEHVGQIYAYPEDPEAIRRLGQSLYSLLSLARRSGKQTRAVRNAVEADVVPASLRGKDLGQKLRNSQDTILVVDDDDEFRSVLAQYLRLIHYTVLQAENGEMALRILRSHKVSLVISDIYMPRMNGFQLYLHLRNDHPGLPAILMTGYNRAVEDVTPGSIEDAVILTKPFSLQNLDPLIRSCLDG